MGSRSLNVVWKFMARNESALYLISRRAVFSLLFTLSALLVTQTGGLTFVTQPNFHIIIIGCLLGTLGLISMISFLEAGSLMLLGYYMLLGVAINGGYTFYFNQSPITVKLMFGSAVLLTGYLLFLWDESKRIKREPVLLSQHLWLIGMTVCFSASGIIQWQVLKEFQPLSLMVTQEFVVLILSSAIYFFVSKPTKLHSLKSHIRFPIMASIIMLAVFAGLMGLKNTNPFIASIGGVLVSLLTVVFGSIFFKEKLSWMQILSFVIIVMGEVLFL